MFENLNIGDLATYLMILSTIEIVFISHLLYKVRRYKKHLKEKLKKEQAREATRRRRWYAC